MKNIIIIQLKNLVRRFTYRLYRFYQNRLAHKFPFYDFETIDIIRQLPVDAVCVDIGANEGQLLQYMYKHCREGKIIAVEPIPYLNKSLKKIYKGKRFSIAPVALSDKKGETVFYHAVKHHSLSGLKPIRSGGQAYEEIKVTVSTLDELLANETRLDFIKIDVEGAEYNVLAGGRNTLSRFHPLIIFESGLGGMEHYDHTPEELFDYLHSLQYKLSTMEYYLGKKEAFTKDMFVYNFRKGYDFQYIAYRNELHESK